MVARRRHCAGGLETHDLHSVTHGVVLDVSASLCSIHDGSVYSYKGDRSEADVLAYARGGYAKNDKKPLPASPYVCLRLPCVMIARMLIRIRECVWCAWWWWSMVGRCRTRETPR